MSTEIILTNNILFNELIKLIKKKNGICHLELYYDTLPELKKRSMENTFKLFMEITGKGIHKADHNNIMLFIKRLGMKYSNNSTYNGKLQEISKLFELYKIDGLVKINLLAHLKAIKRIKNKPVSKAIEELPVNYNDVVNVIVNKDRVTVIIRTLFNTGMRISELINIREKWIDKEGKKHTDIKTLNEFEKSIHIYRKNSKQADIKINNELYNDIKSIFTEKSDFLFHTISGDQYHRSNLYKQITRKFDKYFNNKYLLAELEGKKGKEKREIRKNFKKKEYHIRPHFMRHLFACYKILIEKESAKAVSLALSHSSTAITQDMYCHDKLKNWHII